MNAADFAATAPWSGVRGKPDTFTPSAHHHQIAELDRSGASAGDVPTWTGKKWKALPSGIVALREESTAGFARIDEELSVIASELSSQAVRIGEIEVTFNGGIAALREEVTALASAGSASAQVITDLQARVDTAESQIRQVDEVVVGEIEALARTTEELTARLGQSEATITNISGAYATRTFAEAKRVEAVSASVGAATVLVEEEAVARADADGAIHARWGINLNANGRVIGRINLNGDNDTSTLDFEATTIRIWDGTSAIAPFEVSGGVVRMTNVTVSGVLDISSGANRTIINSTGTQIGTESDRHFKFQQQAVGATALYGRHDASTYIQLQMEYLFPNYYGTLILSDTTSSEMKFHSAGIDFGAGCKMSKNPAAADGWSPGLWDGDNLISFRWDGSEFQVKIDSTVYNLTKTAA